MAARPKQRKRENGRQRLEREVRAYLAFFEEVRGSAPMLEEYPARERTGELVASRIAKYGRRFPR
jgi:hypothetical protein